MDVAIIDKDSFHSMVAQKKVTYVRALQRKQMQNTNVYRIIVNGLAIMMKYAKLHSTGMHKDKHFASLAALSMHQKNY